MKIRNTPSRINSTLSPWSKEGYNKIHQPVGKSIKTTTQIISHYAYCTMHKGMTLQLLVERVIKNSEQIYFHELTENKLHSKLFCALGKSKDSKNILISS